MDLIVPFIQTYGYIAVFIGSILEGESIILLAGLSAHEMFLSFPLVILFAVLGAITCDWGFFFLGRHKKEFLLKKFPRFYRFTQKPHAFIEKRPRLSSFSMRFIYGFRQVISTSIGLSQISARQFMAWNAFGALLWAFMITGIGYIAGEALETVLGSIRHYEFRIILFVVISIAVLNIAGRAIRLIWRKSSGCDIST